MHLFSSLVLLLAAVDTRVTSAYTNNYPNELNNNNGVLNSPCSGSGGNECGRYGYVCSPWNRTCQCKEYYLPHYERRLCLGGVGQRCQYDEGCIEGAYCMQQTSCQCKDHSPTASWDGLHCSGTALPRGLPLITLAVLIALNT